MARRKQAEEVELDPAELDGDKFTPSAAELGPLADEVQSFLERREELARKLAQGIEATERKLAELRRTAAALFPEGTEEEEERERPERKPKKPRAPRISEEPPAEVAAESTPEAVEESAAEEAEEAPSEEASSEEAPTEPAAEEASPAAAETAADPGSDDGPLAQVA